MVELPLSHLGRNEDQKDFLVLYGFPKGSCCRRNIYPFLDGIDCRYWLSSNVTYKLRDYSLERLNATYR